jgi:hypothetical protein
VFRSKLGRGGRRSIRALAVSPASIVPSLAFAAALMIANPAKAAQGVTVPASRFVEYRALPVDLCVPLDRKAARALSSGRAQLVLGLRNQRFVRRYSPPFSVYLYDAGRRRRERVHTFSMQSDIASRTNPAMPEEQLFSIDVRDAPQFAESSVGLLCIALKLERETTENDHDRHAADGAASQLHPQAKPSDRLHVRLMIRMPSP